MPQAKAPSRIRLETKPLMALLRECKANIESLMGDREETNADIALAYERAANAGVPKDALRLALKIFDMDADKRAGFHIAYQLCLEAFGAPMEDELFDAHGMPNVHFPEPEEKKPVGRPPGKKSDAAPAKDAAKPKAAGKGKTAAEGIAETVLAESRKATGHPSIN